MSCKKSTRIALLLALFAICTAASSLWAGGLKTMFVVEMLTSYGSSPTELEKALGKPQSVNTLERGNPIDETIRCYAHTISYDGFKISIFQVEACSAHTHHAPGDCEEKYWVEDFECTSSKYIFNGIKVGDPIQKVIDILGRPTSKSGNSWRFEADDTELGEARCVLEVDKGGKILKITAQYWV